MDWFYGNKNRIVMVYDAHDGEWWLAMVIHGKFNSGQVWAINGEWMVMTMGH